MTLLKTGGGVNFLLLKCVEGGGGEGDYVVTAVKLQWKKIICSVALSPLRARLIGFYRGKGAYWFATSSESRSDVILAGCFEYLSGRDHSEES